ncbi:sugar ABC transporter ATP-binding protein [Kaistia soli]|uniref:sugar ABC transporter ATP-binding protein n=1 Tax=Kaistia soli TaxID=446684 RepID=UPI001FCD1A8C|nr:sugar ABC transporter ATP-binding protein [Kaistia soli]
MTVLDGVSLSLTAGKVHALLGENGAGKSTLINLLSGIHQPDGGTLRIDGQVVAFSGPTDAQRRGISTIHQEFSLFPTLTVAETLFAGRLPVNRIGLVDWRGIAAKTEAVMQQLGADIAPGRRVADLSIAEQQLVEIGRALTLKSRLIIMDEPTASLTPREVGRLKSVIRSLTAEGVAILFVSHRLEEVKELSDSFTVLRDGAVVARGEIADASIDDLVRWMVGRDLLEEGRHHAISTPGAIVLEVDNLSSRPRSARSAFVESISFAVRSGEIVGLAGLVGAGRTEIARLIFGADPIGSGSIRLNGHPFRPSGPGDAIAAGVALVPEDRKHQSLFPSLPISENFAAVGSVRPGPFGFLRRKAERLALQQFRDRLKLRAAGADAPIATLSGGNQQKVILARWLVLKPRLLIVDEPTRGVDIGAKLDLHHLLRELAADGVAILLISSDLPEILALSDRILTIRSGRLTGELAGREADEESLMRLMTLPKAAA